MVKHMRNMKTKMMKDQLGAAAIEFALILPLLMLVVFGTIEFGLLLFNQHVVTNASREGARAGIVSRLDRFEVGDAVDVEQTVFDWLQEHLVTFGADNLVIDVRIEDENDPGNFYRLDDPIFDPDTGAGDPCTGFECPLRIEVSYDYDFLVLSIFGFGPKTLVGRSTMLME